MHARAKFLAYTPKPFSVHRSPVTPPAPGQQKVKSQQSCCSVSQEYMVRFTGNSGEKSLCVKNRVHFLYSDVRWDRVFLRQVDMVCTHFGFVHWLLIYADYSVCLGLPFTGGSGRPSALYHPPTSCKDLTRSTTHSFSGLYVNFNTSLPRLLSIS
jgi:hypothetical protein